MFVCLSQIIIEYAKQFEIFSLTKKRDFVRDIEKVLNLEEYKNFIIRLKISEIFKDKKWVLVPKFVLVIFDCLKKFLDSESDYKNNLRKKY